MCSPQALDFYDGTATNKAQRPSLTLTFATGSPTIRGEGAAAVGDESAAWSTDAMDNDGVSAGSGDRLADDTTSTRHAFVASPALLAVGSAAAAFVTIGAALVAVQRLRQGRVQAKPRHWHVAAQAGNGNSTNVTSPLGAKQRGARGGDGSWCVGKGVIGESFVRRRTGSAAGLDDEHQAAQARAVRVAAVAAAVTVTERESL